MTFQKLTCKRDAPNIQVINIRVSVRIVARQQVNLTDLQSVIKFDLVMVFNPPIIFKHSVDVMATHESSVDVATAQDVDMECPGDDPALCTVLVRELEAQCVFQLTVRRKTKLENAQEKEVEEVRKGAIYSVKLIFFRVKL